MIQLIHIDQSRFLIKIIMCLIKQSVHKQSSCRRKIFDLLIKQQNISFNNRGEELEVHICLAPGRKKTDRIFWLKHSNLVNNQT